jgi:hypothetical protein
LAVLVAQIFHLASSKERLLFSFQFPSSEGSGVGRERFVQQPGSETTTEINENTVGKPVAEVPGLLFASLSGLLRKPLEFRYNFWHQDGILGYLFIGIANEGRSKWQR